MSIPPISEIILKKVQLGVTNHLSDEAIEKMQVEYAIDVVSGQIIMAFETYVYAETVDEQEQKVNFEYPASPWQFFKFKYFPEFMLKRFPVKNATATKTVHYEKKAVYPQLPIAIGKNVRHVKFIADYSEYGRTGFEKEEDEF